VPLILAVDDEHSGLYFRKLILEHAGYAVLSATGVDEALRLFRSNPVDLVVTDHLLGRQVGTEMAREMKRSKPSVPVIVLSGTSSIPEPLVDVSAFLSKNEGPEQLLELVKKLLDSLPESRNPQLNTDLTAPPLQSLLAAVVEDSDDAIFSKTLDGIVLTWNGAAERMYGYRADEVIGKSVSMLLPQDRTTEVEEILTRLRQGGRIEHFETTRQTKEGRMLNVSLTVSPVRDAQGNIIAASTIARDITQAKLAEEAIRNSERLALAGRMAATITHEINNPLEIVTNILYLLAKDQSLGETARQYVGKAEEELRRVGQITRSTLGLYRERDTAIVPVNIAELIDSILPLYGRRLQSLYVQVDKRFEAAGNIVGVAGELRQVFSNLIANAIDALTITGTKLVMHVRDSRDWSDLSRRGIRVTIADDGSGMSVETRANLFQPFFTTKGQKGTGVGLWVSRGIVAKHGGSIRLWSNTGARHGTCFSVFLPNHPEFAPASTI
jgi:two-component system, chemotaxis family, CheB/CheR fusion protein